MFENLSARNRGEIAKSLDRFKFEMTGDGTIHLPEQKLFIGGAFMHRLNGGDPCIDPNLWVDAGLLDLFKVYVNGTTARTTMYIAPFSQNVAPTNVLTGATFVATQGEFTNYTETNRPAWNHGTVTALPATNAANPARFTIGDPADGDTIWGAALLTNSTKSNTAGFMPVCAQFAAVRNNLQEGDKIDIEYALTATSE